MPAFGKDGILKPEEIQSGRELRAHAQQARAGTGRRRRRRQETVRRQLRRLPRRRRQGQLRVGSANLTDGLQLYGSDFKDLVYTITNARNRRCRPGADASIR